MDGKGKTGNMFGRNVGPGGGQIVAGDGGGSFGGGRREGRVVKKIGRVKGGTRNE